MRPDQEPVPTYEELRTLAKEFYEDQAKLVYYELMARLAPVKE